MAWFDLHWGFENKDDFPQPNAPVEAIHNVACLNAAMKLAEQFQPTVFIAGGDWIDGKAISHWNLKKPLRTENLRIGQDLEGLKKQVIDPLSRSILPRKCEKVWIPGNHERFFMDAAEAAPGMSDLLDYRKIIGLEKTGWNVLKHGGMYRLNGDGKVYFCHGDIPLGKIGSEGAAAKKLVSRYHRSVRCGHLHTAQQYLEQTAIDQPDYHDGKIVPCMATRAPLFTKGNPNNWVNGILVGYAMDDGTFWDQILLFIDGSFMWEGRRISG